VPSYHVIVRKLLISSSRIEQPTCTPTRRANFISLSATFRHVSKNNIDPLLNDCNPISYSAYTHLPTLESAAAAKAYIPATKVVHQSMSKSAA